MLCQEETEGREGLYGVGLAVKESTSRKSFYIYQLIDERLMPMRFGLTGECAALNLVIAYEYAPTETNPNTELKEVSCNKLGYLVKQNPTR